MEHTFTDANFDAEVLKSDIPVLVDFWATWCPPCRILGPIVDAVADELDGSKIKIGKLDVDNNGGSAMTYGVMSIPTLIVFKGGKEVDRMVGVQEKDALKAALAKHM